ncbi:MAG: LamG domain-containing protein [Verrucomicrobia bacterium]|nr:LamG domain-containing protein [Verrucomicrobiota bacterium]
MNKLIFNPFHQGVRAVALGVIVGFNSLVSLPAQETATAALQKALTFYASFDGTTNADFALGDPQIYTAGSMKHPRTGQPGLPASGVVTHVPGQGRFGSAMRFHKKASEMVFFKAEKNVAYQTNNWSGTVSLWLRLNPQMELAPGYCDPIQITPREWNDAAFFVEFEKKTNSIPFRLGAYADFKVWNPQNRDWNAIPFSEKPLLAVEKPPFGGDRWTHVVFTFENFNTGRKDGVARLYLNAEPQGALTDRVQTFTWDTSKALVMLGLSYVGLYDELAIFNRALTASEVKALHQLTEVHRLLPQSRSP